MKALSLKLRQNIFVWCCIIPAFLFFLVFYLIPIFNTLIGSFYDWNALTGKMTFNGLSNYEEAFTDKLMFKSFYNTIYLTFFAVLIKTILAFSIALAVNSTKRIQSFYRGVFFLPTICTMIATAFVFRFLLQPEAGTINGYLSLLGITTTPGWLEEVKWALPTVILYTIWKDFGYVFLIFLAGIQGIPADVIEASYVDGANGFNRIRFIVLPLLKPITIYNIVTQVIGSMQIFTSIIALTNNVTTSTAGGPMYATTTAGLYIYQTAFTSYKFGYASALSMILFASIMIFTVIQIKTSRMEGDY